MKGRFKVQNFYKTTLSSQILPGDTTDTTEKSFVISEEPQVDAGWVVVDLLDPTKTDIIFFHRREGNTLYYYEYNRSNPNANHIVGAYVQMNDVAELFNYAFRNIDDFGDIKQLEKPGLRVEVKGGTLNIGLKQISVNDATLVLPDDSTIYIYVDINNSTFNFTDTFDDTKINVSKIKTFNGDIETIEDIRPLNHIMRIVGDLKNNDILTIDTDNNVLRTEPKPFPNLYVTTYNGTNVTVNHNMGTDQITAYIQSDSDIIIPSITVIDKDTVEVSTTWDVAGELFLIGGLGVYTTSISNTEYTYIADEGNVKIGYTGIINIVSNSDGISTSVVDDGNNTITVGLDTSSIETQIDTINGQISNLENKDTDLQDQINTLSNDVAQRGRIVNGTIDTASTTWNIEHNLNTTDIADVFTWDSNGNKILGDIDIVDENNVTVTFSTEQSGRYSVLAL